MRWNQRKIPVAKCGKGKSDLRSHRQHAVHAMVKTHQMRQKKTKTGGILALRKDCPESRGRGGKMPELSKRNIGRKPAAVDCEISNDFDSEPEIGAVLLPATYKKA